MTMVEVLDCLLEADGDEDAEDDCAEMDEEIAACGGGVVGWVDVDHVGSVKSIPFRRAGLESFVSAASG